VVERSETDHRPGGPAEIRSRKWGRRFMKKFALAAVMLGVSALQAYAQSSQPKQQDTNSKTLLQLEAEERRRQAQDVDADYDRAMKRSRATPPNAAVDPWQSVRPGK